MIAARWNRKLVHSNLHPAPHRLASVILAAGRSRRLGWPKAFLPIGRGEPAWQRIVEDHLSLGLTPRLVVSRPTYALLQEAGLPGDLLILNGETRLGPLHSLHLALKTLARASGVLLHPVDHPLVARSTLEVLQARHANRPDCILIPRVNGRKGHPVVFPRRFFRELQTAPLETGARFVVRRHLAAVHYLDVCDQGIRANLNRPQDLHKWRILGHWLHLPAVVQEA